MTADPGKDSTSTIERLLIVRLGAMGDILHSLPAATALRQAFPEASIGWLLEERWGELLCSLATPRSGDRSPQRPLVDHVHTVNTLSWRKSPWASGTWEQIGAAISELRAQHYEIAVDLQGAIRSAVLARWSNAPVVYGMRQPRENVASMFYTRQVMPQGTHVVEQFFAVAEEVAGRSLTMPPVELPCDAAAEAASDRMLSELGIRDFALLNPGAGWGAKQWPAERYGEVARRLGEGGLKSLINCGPGEESLVETVVSGSGGAAAVIKNSLSVLIALTRRARVFIGGDTGPLHLAAALQVPVVAIFGPTDPARNGPYGTRSIVLRSSSSRTSHSRRAEPEQGLLAITSADVISAARELLKGHRD